MFRRWSCRHRLTQLFPPKSKLYCPCFSDKHLLHSLSPYLVGNLPRRALVISCDSHAIPQPSIADNLFARCVKVAFVTQCQSVGLFIPQFYAQNLEFLKCYGLLPVVLVLEFPSRYRKAASLPLPRKPLPTNQ